MYSPLEGYGVTWQLTQFLIIDIIYLVATGGKGNVQVFLIVGNRLAKACIE